MVNLYKIAHNYKIPTKASLNPRESMHFGLFLRCSLIGLAWRQNSFRSWRPVYIWALVILVVFSQILILVVFSQIFVRGMHLSVLQQTIPAFSSTPEQYNIKMLIWVEKFACLERFVWTSLVCVKRDANDAFWRIQTSRQKVF